MFANKTKKKPNFNNRINTIASPNIYINEEANNKLFSIISSGNYNEIKNAITSNKFNIKALNENNDTIVHLLLNGDNQNINSENIINILKILKTFNIFLNNKNKTGVRPIHLACKLGNYEITKFLLKDNIDLSVKDYLGKTPFHYVIQGKIVTADNVEEIKIEPETIKIPDNIISSNELSDKNGDYNFKLKKKYITDYLSKYKINNLIFTTDQLHNLFSDISIFIINIIDIINKYNKYDELTKLDQIFETFKLQFKSLQQTSSTNIKYLKIEHQYENKFKYLYKLIYSLLFYFSNIKNVKLLHFGYNFSNYIIDKKLIQFIDDNTLNFENIKEDYYISIIINEFEKIKPNLNKLINNINSKINVNETTEKDIYEAFINEIGYDSKTIKNMFEEDIITKIEQNYEALYNVLIGVWVYWYRDISRSFIEFLNYDIGYNNNNIGYLYYDKDKDSIPIEININIYNLLYKKRNIFSDSLIEDISYNFYIFFNEEYVEDIINITTPIKKRSIKYLLSQKEELLKLLNNDIILYFYLTIGINTIIKENINITKPNNNLYKLNLFSFFNRNNQRNYELNEVGENNLLSYLHDNPSNINNIYIAKESNSDDVTIMFDDDNEQGKSNICELIDNIDKTENNYIWELFYKKIPTIISYINEIDEIDKINKYINTEINSEFFQKLIDTINENSELLVKHLENDIIATTINIRIIGIKLKNIFTEIKDTINDTNLHQKYYSLYSDIYIKVWKPIFEKKYGYSNVIANTPDETNLTAVVQKSGWEQIKAIEDIIDDIINVIDTEIFSHNTKKLVYNLIKKTGFRLTKFRNFINKKINNIPICEIFLNILKNLLKNSKIKTKIINLNIYRSISNILYNLDLINKKIPILQDFLLYKPGKYTKFNLDDCHFKIIDKEHLQKQIKEFVKIMILSYKNKRIIYENESKSDSIGYKLPFKKNNYLSVANFIDKFNFFLDDEVSSDSQLGKPIHKKDTNKSNSEYNKWNLTNHRKNEKLYKNFASYKTSPFNNQFPQNQCNDMIKDYYTEINNLIKNSLNTMSKKQQYNKLIQYIETSDLYIYDKEHLQASFAINNTESKIYNEKNKIKYAYTEKKEDNLLHNIEYTAINHIKFLDDFKKKYDKGYYLNEKYDNKILDNYLKTFDINYYPDAIKRSLDTLDNPLLFEKFNYYLYDNYDEDEDEDSIKLIPESLFHKYHYHLHNLKHIFYNHWLFSKIFKLDEFGEKEKEKLLNMMKIKSNSQKQEFDFNLKKETFDKYNRKGIIFLFFFIFKLLNKTVVDGTNNKKKVKQTIYLIFLNAIFSKYKSKFKTMSSTKINIYNSEMYFDKIIYQLFKKENINNISLVLNYLNFENNEFKIDEYNSTTLILDKHFYIYENESYNLSKLCTDYDILHDDKLSSKLTDMTDMTDITDITNIEKKYELIQNKCEYFYPDKNNNNIKNENSVIFENIYACTHFINQYKDSIVTSEDLEDSDNIKNSLYNFKTKNQLLKKLYNKDLYHYEYIPHIDIQTNLELPNKYEFIEINKKLIDLFLQKNININIVDNFNKTPLHYALSFLGSKIIRKLINKQGTLIFKNVNSKSPFEFFIELFNNYCDILTIQNSNNNEEEDTDSENDELEDHKKHKQKINLDILNECYYKSIWNQLLDQMTYKNKKKTLQIYEHLFEEFIRNINRQIIFPFITKYQKNIPNFEIDNNNPEKIHIILTEKIKEQIYNNGIRIQKNEEKIQKNVENLNKVFNALLDENFIINKKMNNIINIHKHITDHSKKKREFYIFIYYIIKYNNTNPDDTIIEYLNNDILKEGTSIKDKDIINLTETNIFYNVFYENNNHINQFKYNNMLHVQKIILIKLYNYFNIYLNKLSTENNLYNVQKDKDINTLYIYKIFKIINNKIYKFISDYKKKNKSSEEKNYELLGIVSNIQKSGDNIILTLTSMYPGVNLDNNENPTKPSFRINEFSITANPDSSSSSSSLTFENNKIKLNNYEIKKIHENKNDNKITKRSIKKKDLINIERSNLDYPYLYIERSTNIYSLNAYYDIMISSNNNKYINENIILDRIVNATITSIIFNYIITNDLPDIIIKYIYKNKTITIEAINLINLKFEIIDKLKKNSNLIQTFINFGNKCIHLFFYNNLSVDDIENTENPLFKLDTFFNLIKHEINNQYNEINSEFLKKDSMHELNDINELNDVNENLINKYLEIFYIFLSNARKLFIHYIDYIKNQTKFLNILNIFIEKIKILNKPYKHIK